ncbi:double homeobox protein 1-like isoform X2 [Macaca fascicularis]|uniref:double homeobox protein 1-like isoform X2 n=1 Tax=Macaca fascicularis TaxID=9541 RepID=UPI0032B05B52
MDLAKSSNGSLEREARRKRIVLNQHQKDTLQAWFEKNPYPGIAARDQLAKEIGIPEPRIQVWFQNHRSRQRRLGLKCCFEEYQTQGQTNPQFGTQAKEAGRIRTSITRSQVSILVQAFEKNQFPGIATREELAKQTGLPESRIQMEFRSVAQTGVQCSGTMSARCNLCLLDSSDSCASASRVAGTTGVHHHAHLIFVFLVEMGFHHVVQAGLELLT